MDRGLINEVIAVLQAGEPLRRSEDAARLEAAAIRHRVAWQRVLWALLDLCALLEIRAELAVGQRSLSAEIRSLGFHDAPDELFALLAARVDQTRAVLRAFIFEGKVTLDLLSKAVIETIGPARGREEIRPK